jgi:hypothetical protein
MRRAEARERKVERAELTLERLLVRKVDREPDAEEHSPEISVPETSAEVTEPPAEMDSLSSAWLLQIAKPMDEALAARQAGTGHTEILSEPARKGLGAPPRVTEPEEPSSDSMLEIEQELFAPANAIAQIPSVPEAPPSAGGAMATRSTRPALQSHTPRAVRACGPVPARAGPPLRATPGISRAMPRSVPDDPLAPIKSMTDEERIALFT